MALNFQDMNPETFVTLAQILANVWAAELPLNEQYAIGNWLQLVGQSMVAYNAQQQYFQSGPGLFYNIRNKNVSNPLCPRDMPQATVNSDIAETDTMGPPPQCKRNYNCSTCNQRCMYGMGLQIEELKERIQQMEKLIKDITKGNYR